MADPPLYMNPYRRFPGSFVPEWLELRPEVSFGAKAVYARLARYAGKDGACHPAVKTMAKALAVSPRQLLRYTAELEGFGLIVRERRGLGCTNTYRFLDHSWLAHDGPKALPQPDPEPEEQPGPDTHDVTDTHLRGDISRTPEVSGLSDPKEESHLKRPDIKIPPYTPPAPRAGDAGEELDSAPDPFQDSWIERFGEVVGGADVAREALTRLRALKPIDGSTWDDHFDALILAYARHYGGEPAVAVRLMEALDYWERNPKKTPKQLGAYAALRSQLEMGLQRNGKGARHESTQRRTTTYSAW